MRAFARMDAAAVRDLFIAVNRAHAPDDMREAVERVSPQAVELRRM